MGRSRDQNVLLLGWRIAINAPYSAFNIASLVHTNRPTNDFAVQLYEHINYQNVYSCKSSQARVSTAY